MPSRTALRGSPRSSHPSPAHDARGEIGRQPGPNAVLFGIDPGTRVVGYGAIRLSTKGPRPLVAGAITTTRSATVPMRLGEIRAELDDLLRKWKPDIVVVEEAFAARNVQSALRIGEGRGVALAAAAMVGAHIVQYPPAVVKKVLIGHGAAHKDQVAHMVAQILGLDRPPEPLDATDALALALAHSFRLSDPLSNPSGEHTVERTSRTPRQSH